MNTEPKIHSFEELKNELIHFQGNDVLVHIHAKSQLWEEISLPEDTTEITVPFDGKWEKLYKRFNDFYKSTGIQTACYVSKTITWKYKDQFIESPLVLTPLEVQRNKNTQQLTFHLDTEQTFLNPFIEKQFREQFEVELELDKLDQQIPVLLQNLSTITTTFTTFIKSRILLSCEEVFVKDNFTSSPLFFYFYSFFYFLYYRTKWKNPLILVSLPLKSIVSIV